MSTKCGVIISVVFVMVSTSQIQKINLKLPLPTPPSGFHCQSNDECPDYQCCNKFGRYPLPDLVSKRFLLQESYYIGSRCENYTRPGESCSPLHQNGCRCMPGYYCGRVKIPTTSPTVVSTAIGVPTAADKPTSTEPSTTTQARMRRTIQVFPEGYMYGCAPFSV